MDSPADGSVLAGVDGNDAKVSPASERSSLSLVGTVSTALPAVSEAAEEEASEWYFFRSRNSPAGLGRRHMGSAGDSVVFTVMLWMGLSCCCRCCTVCAITAAALATRAFASMLTRPIL